MIASEAIVVGAGPAGAACAFELKQRSIRTLVLDRSPFPRHKVCAGWITPRVLDLLALAPERYPHAMTRFDRLLFHLWGRTFAVRTRQYAIRRYEFDNWMIARARVPVRTHKVKTIIREKGRYIIDDTYSCRYLIGAGGTHCPVQKTFFNPTRPRCENALVAAVEAEYPWDCRDRRCHIWFFQDTLPGYAWYLPKAGGYLNIGIGGKLARLRQQGRTIMDHWRRFIETLYLQGLIRSMPPAPRGHTYYLRQPVPRPRIGNAFVIGDAAGLSTLDMGEGIFAAITSGIAAAGAISGHTPLSFDRMPRFSLPAMMFPPWK
ncbi:MAG: NAD(P)/FAD-dependent oxidoreductase [Desulfobacteraceae bacterium]|nr:NAD(P)/FAD-dependent oxidoreductase [Desulfobacteraceae bacterium]